MKIEEWRKFFWRSMEMKVILRVTNCGKHVKRLKYRFMGIGKPSRHFRWFGGPLYMLTNFLLRCLCSWESKECNHSVDRFPDMIDFFWWTWKCIGSFCHGYLMLYAVGVPSCSLYCNLVHLKEMWSRFTWTKVGRIEVVYQFFCPCWCFFYAIQCTGGRKIFHLRWNHGCATVN